MRLSTAATVVLLLTFLVVGPALLLWTSGYRWNPRTGRLEATGILVVDSIPSGAAVAIGEEATDSFTPARFTSLLPREYTITVSKQGYRPWRQTVSVQAGRTAFANAIRLFPETLPELVLEKPVRALALTKDGTRIAAAVSTDGPAEIWTLDAASGAAALLARLSGDAVSAMRWSPGGTGLLVLEAEDGGVRVNVFGEGARQALVPPRGALAEAAWSADDSNRVIGIGAAGTATGTVPIWLFPARGDAVLLATASSTPGRGAPPLPLLKGGILTMARRLATTTAISTLTLGNGREEATLLTLPDGPFAPLDAPDPYLLLADRARERLFLVDRDRRTAIADVPATDAVWSTGGATALLAWDDVELHLIRPDGAADTLARTSQGIRAARWTADGSHALLLTRNALVAVERDSLFGERTTVPLADFAEAYDVVVAGDAAYVAGTVGTRQGVWKVKLK